MGLPQGFMMQNAKLVPALAPATMAGAADGDWVSLKAYDKVGILVHITQGNAATTAITVDAGSSVAGANLNAGITMSNWWYITDTAIGTDAGVNSDTWTKGAAGVAITSSATGTGASAYYIEVNADELVSGSAFGIKYDCLQLKLGASDVANIACAWYVMHPSRYAVAVSPTPSAIID
jgi:hypothetical protein